MGRYKNLWNKLRANLANETIKIADSDKEEAYRSEADHLKRMMAAMCMMECEMLNSSDNVDDDDRW